MQDVIKIFERWKAYDGLEQNMKEELFALTDENEIYDRFYKPLEFGTGGLRGVLGAGTNRINIYTIRGATQGLANYINEYYSEGKERYQGRIPSVAIAYDSRIQSDVFAQEAAKVLMANGIEAYLYKELMPTPALSYAVRYYQCTAGIMVTASHNPAQYNGYKVYNEEGCQMTLKDAGEVLKHIEGLDYFQDVKWVEKEPHWIPQEVTEAFYTAVLQQRMGVDCRSLSVVYTPLNGTGNLPVRIILGKIGVSRVQLVKEQELPDGTFPTCPYPNPEKKEALKLGLALCEQLGDVDLLLATDPDCDRIGIAVRHKEEKEVQYRLVTGNEIGVLLLDFLCQCRICARTKTEEGLQGKSPVKPMPNNPIAMKTIVSSKMAAAVAKRYGVTMIDLLTGFKFIGEQIGILERKGEVDRFIFGFEESYGYLSGSHVRDKDAVNASMLICEMTAFYKEQHKTLIDRLTELYREYGYYLNDLMEFAFEGAVGMDRMNAIMEKLRAEAPKELIHKKVVEIADYKASLRYITGRGACCDLLCGTKPIGLPKSDVLEYILEDGSSFIVRPSGTEPKLKIYLSARGETKAASVEMVENMKKEIKLFISG